MYGDSRELKRGKCGVRDINVAYHAQVIHKGGKPGTSFVVAEQLRLVAMHGEGVELGKGGVLDGGAAHGIHRYVQIGVGG